MIFRGRLHLGSLCASTASVMDAAPLGALCRRTLAVFGLSVCLGTSALAADGIRLAVAPFDQSEIATRSKGVDLASLLGDALSSRALERWVSSEDLSGEVDDLAPGLADARDVRGWAEEAKVDAVVVGLATPSKSREGFELEVEVRSGHSGASIARFVDEVADVGTFTNEAEPLAAAILDSLGYVEPTPPVAAPADPDPDSAKEGDGGGLDLGGLRSKEKIEIHSEELEVIQEDKSRHLIFSKQVKVTQADMMLRTDRLEAFYPEGSSQPDKLVARGRVRVNQGERRAKCDQAIYEREAQIVVCRGHAELVQGCDRVRGKEIRFDLAGERVRVTGAPSVVIYPDDEESDSCAGDVS